MIEEVLGTDTDTLLSELMQGIRLAAELCPDKYALIDIYDGYMCDESNQRIYVQRYPNLSNEPEFSSIFNSGTTPNDALLDYHILKLEELGYNEINTVHKTRTRINVIDIDKNKTTATVPASLLEMRYENTEAVDRRAFMMLLATNATSNPDSITGYILSYKADTIQQPSGIPPQPLSQIFPSFQLLNDAENGDSFVHRQDNGQFENYDDFKGTSPAQLPWNVSLPSIASDMGSTNIDSSE